MWVWSDCGWVRLAHKQCQVGFSGSLLTLQSLEFQHQRVGHLD